MTPKALRMLADCLDSGGPVDPADSRLWAHALRHFAKDIERSVLREEVDAAPLEPK